MSKYKTRNQISQTDLLRRTCRGKEIAPLFVGHNHLPFAYRVQLAQRAALAAGYLAVAVSAARSQRCDVYILVRAEWKPAPWPSGKWGHPTKGLRFTPAAPFEPRLQPRLLAARVGI